MAGFDAPKQLARKVVRAYRLASEQLSLHGHYDWGMRAVRSVLAMAGSLRRAGPGRADAYAVWNALHCSTLPKLVGADIQLFLAILSDLFPGMTPMAEVITSHSVLERSCISLRESFPVLPSLTVHG
jgi:dynein heavy chain